MITPVYRAANSICARTLALGLFVLLVGCSTDPVLDSDLSPIEITAPATEVGEAKSSGASDVDCPAQLNVADDRAEMDLKFSFGNSALLRIDGPGTFSSMFEDIDAATDHIHIETYILEDDDVGKSLAEHLIASRKRGVEVRLLIDAYGSMNLSADYVARLQSHGIVIQKFHPIDPSEDVRIWRSNNRDHRKLLIIDGEVAYTGGINFSDVYREGSLSIRPRTPDHESAWRDTQVRVVGPAVGQFQHYFLQMWNLDLPDEEQVSGEHYTPESHASGDIAVAVAASAGGDSDEFEVYSVFVSAIGQSQRRVWITQAYFAPDDNFITLLKTVAERGVDVRLLLPGVSDASLVIQASRSSYQTLLESGVRIYERHSTVLHAKTMVIDGRWSTIGSANFDYRSFVHNYELNAVLESCKFGAAMEKLFEVDVQQAEEITLAEWQERPITQRFEEWLGNMFREWL